MIIFLLIDRYEPGKLTLWGGCVRRLLSGNAIEDFQYSYHDILLCPKWIAVSLTGPSLSSWSIVLDLKLTSFEAEEKLLEFKKSIKLKSKTTAFGWIPVIYDWNSVSSSSSEEESDFDSDSSDTREYKERMLEQRVLKNSVENSFNETKVFNEVFPDITLSCIYNKNDLPSFCISSFDNCKYNLLHPCCNLCNQQLKYNIINFFAAIDDEEQLYDKITYLIISHD